MLRKGVSIDTFTIGHTTVSGFFLQWQNKLSIHADSVTLSADRKGSDSQLNIRSLAQIIKTTDFFGNFFSQISVEKITIGDLAGSFYFNQGDTGTPSFLTLVSSDLNVHANLEVVQKSLVVTITSASSKRFKSVATGQIRFQNRQKLFTGSLLLNLGGSLPLSLQFSADKNSLSFQGKETGEIHTITPFVELFGLDKNLRRWLTDNLKASRFVLKTFKGTLPWKNPKALLDTFYAEVRVDNCAYVFAPGFQPLKSPVTELIFKKGILAIHPRNATFHGQELKSSWLEFNFTDPRNILLNVYITTRAVLNEDILAVLKHYGIALPFKQTGGQTAVDVTVTVDLNKRQTTASATLLIDKGRFAYRGKTYSLTDTKIILQGSTVTIRGNINLKNLFSAEINGSIDFRKGSSELNVSVHQLAFDVGKSVLSLDTSKTNLLIAFHRQAGKNLINFAPSSWHLGDLPIHLDSSSTLFSTENLSLVIPPTHLTISSKIMANISGSVSIKKKQADLHCELLQYDIGGIHLAKPGVLFFIRYDNGLAIQSKKSSQWNINNIPTTLSPTNFTYNDNVMAIQGGRISYGHFFDGHISGHYNNSLQHGVFFLKNLHIRDKHINFLFADHESLLFQVGKEKENFVITIPVLDLKISAGTDKSWSATFSDLTNISSLSPYLQKLQLHKGTLTVSSADGKIPYDFAATIPYDYSFLVEGNKPIHNLLISGTITQNGFDATVNKKMHIRYDKQVTITSSGLKYNIPEITRFIKKQTAAKTRGPEKRKPIPFTLDARNSSLFFKPGSEALADRLYLKYVDQKTTMRLDHGPGSISFIFNGDTFSCDGKNLNDVFMTALIKDSHFKNGRMSITAKGTFDNFSVLFKLDDTLLTRLNALSNILSFINTIPALITFSLPDFNTNGLSVSSAIIGMIVKNGIATIESLTLNSPKMTLGGNGEINFPQNTINMHLNVTTQAKANINKIPLVGYILVGKKKRPSIAINISGDLQNPEVQNSMFKDAISLPFNILLRTLALPLHLIGSMMDHEQGKEASESK